MQNEFKMKIEEARNCIENQKFVKAVGLLHPFYSSVQENSGAFDHDLLLDYYIALGEGYFYSGQLKEAKKIFDEGLKHIDEKSVGMKGAELLNDSAVLDKKTGFYERASYKFNLSLDCVKKQYGKNNQNYLNTLLNIALLYNLLGQYTESERCFREILLLTEKGRGIPDLFIMRIKQSYAFLLTKLGKKEAAREMYFSTLRMRAEKFGYRSVFYCETLNNIALFYRPINRNTSEIIYRKTLEICGEIMGKDDFRVAKTERNLALIAYEKDNLIEAKGLLEKALVKMKASAVESSIEYIKTRIIFLSVSWRLADANETDLDREFAEMTEYFRTKKEIFTAEYIDFLIQYSQYLIANDKRERYFDCVKEAISLQNEYILSLIRGLSEEASLNVLKNLERDTGYFISTLIQFGKEKEFAEFMYQAITFRKGLVFEVSLMHRIEKMDDPNIKRDLEVYKRLRNELARRLFSGIAPNESEKDFVEIKKDLIQKCNELEENILKLLPNERMELRDRIKKTLSEFIPLNRDEYLFDFYKYKKYDFNQNRCTDEYRYCKVFIKRNGDYPVFHVNDIEKADVIENEIRAYRLTLYGYRDEHQKYGKRMTSIQKTIESCRSLYKMLFDEFNSEIVFEGEKIPHIYLCPDGEIAQIAFESLLTEDDLYLIEKTSISYCNSVRDLSLYGSRKNQYEAMIFADPEYDLFIEKGQFPGNYGEIRYKRLENARDEATEIENVFKTNTGKTPELFYGKEVSKKRIKSINSPSILHIITHGYFIDEALPEFLHPLTKSGIVLSGVNAYLAGQKLPEEYENGFLSAYDAAVLNLKNNELLVLSACETGLGEINVGEGVMGLRRGFAQAGSKTIIMSLWRVSDEYTKILMIRFFENIFKGQKISTALRNAQLFLIDYLYEAVGFASPVIWSGFICQGDISPLIEPQDVFL